MYTYMPEKEKGAVKNPSSTLIAFKPRQVILAEQHQKPSSSPLSSSSKPTLMALVEKKKEKKNLTAEQNTQLLHSVLCYLQTNHFSKSLKRLLKDAQIQGDSWKATTLDLEDIFRNYLENCTHVDSKLANHKELEMQGDKREHHGDAAASQETVCKKKKKKTDEKDNNGTVTHSENIASDKDTESDVKLKKQKDKKMEPIKGDTLSSVRDSEVEESSKKQKIKNKNKITSESLDQDAKQSDLKSGLTEEKLKNDIGEIEFKETAKAKDKKKKNKPSTEPLIEDQKLCNSKNSTMLGNKSNSDIPLEESEVKPKEKKRKKEEKEKKSFVTSDNGAGDYNDSKKRKRLASSANESQPVEESMPGETKRRKIEDPEEAKNVEQKGTVISLVDERTNGDFKNGVEKSGQRKQRNGSAEPKTVNAFQRVKIDEVEFVDERLQDNSYWAKDGAEIGYGAKAQEILGQVRGRDFRHEKTKKKRGSYRGGQIDLQSHSVKFNYSDEE